MDNIKTLQMYRATEPTDGYVEKFCRDRGLTPEDKFIEGFQKFVIVDEYKLQRDPKSFGISLTKEDLTTYVDPFSVQKYPNDILPFIIGFRGNLKEMLLWCKDNCEGYFSMIFTSSIPAEGKPDVFILFQKQSDFSLCKLIWMPRNTR